ncbi:Retrovirus-related Pol polyprotein from transposon [Apostichopus japonicus]|uniref:Retrovirus-related Pol polyprotein from transposon n=1 Tax=Stichopus japonicus TaxID=307972 RepID=A0A2G8JS77_STIJA|nr:Retrovirus-related Pol polyprotein from transposon [Apostichopus japonicus]
MWKEVQHSRPDWAQITTGSTALKNYWSQWERLVLKRGVLYRKFESDTGKSALLQLLVPERIREDILRGAHNHRLSGHLMAKKTLSRIRGKFYWSGYRNHVRNWCRSCDQCAARKGPKKKLNARMKQYGAGHPLQRCAMDIMGPLPISTRGNRYILVVADYFTKWTEAYAIADMEAQTVARTLVEEFICRYGIPEELHTDQGRQFESELFQCMCRLLDIKKTRTTPFHPQSDGMVERFNRTLEDMLSLVVSENQKDWDSWLPYMLMAYRSAEHESTGFPPAELMFGRAVDLPLTSQLPKPPWTQMLQTNRCRNM